MHTQTHSPNSQTVTVADIKDLCTKLQVQLEDSEVQSLFSVISSGAKGEPIAPAISPTQVHNCVEYPQTSLVSVSAKELGICNHKKAQ